MATPQFELYHGIVLAQIIRSPRINVKLLERNSEFSWGAYEITDNQITHRVFVKSTAIVRNTRKKGYSSSFTFTESDINTLRSINSDKNLVICLVCADKEVCTLIYKDIDEMRLLFEKSNASIIVSWLNNSSLHVKCRGIKLEHSIPRNRLANFNWI